MALFFDQVWFDAQLAARHLRREDLATMLGLDSQGLADLWKDQRELSTGDVAVIAALFSVPPEEVARRAGVSTPVPQMVSSATSLEERLAAIENKLDEILKRLDQAASEKMASSDVASR